MKKTTLALAVAIAGFASMANAALPENSWYVGGKLGWSKFFDTNSQNVAGTSKVDTNQVGGGAFIGYQATPYLAAELGYDWLGNLDYKGENGNRNGRLKVHGASFTGKASYPLAFISEDLDIYARAGAFMAVTKWTENGVSSSSDVDVSPTYALGLDYRINKDFATRLEYQWVNNIDNDGPNRPDNALLSLGVTYLLGGGPTEKASEYEYRENRYVLNQDVLFTYGKSSLKAEGVKELDNLVNELTKLNPSESAIVVIGHADRIGSEAFNQKLSEQRAKSVMDYFVSKGVPSDLISARGVGKTQSVTGDQCSALKGADLKACLAPDRRVEIQVNANKLESVEVTE